MNTILDPEQQPLHVGPALVEVGFALAAVVCAALTAAVLLHAAGAF